MIRRGRIRFGFLYGQQCIVNLRFVGLRFSKVAPFMAQPPLKLFYIERLFAKQIVAFLAQRGLFFHWYHIGSFVYYVIRAVTTSLYNWIFFCCRSSVKFNITIWRSTWCCIKHFMCNYMQLNQIVYPKPLLFSISLIVIKYTPFLNFSLFVGTNEKKVSLSLKSHYITAVNYYMSHGIIEWWFHCSLLHRLVSKIHPNTNFATIPPIASNTKTLHFFFEICI